MSIKLLIADEQEIVRAGLYAMFEHSDVEIIATAQRPDQIAQLIEATRPDVVLLDIRMRDPDGPTPLAEIHRRFPALPVLVFSAYDNPAYEARAMACGAVGYVLKTARRDELLAFVRQAAGGEKLWTRGDVRRLSGFTATAEPLSSGDVPLTPRELEVLRRLSAGETNNQIAAALGISTETVKEHVQHILRKLGVTDRTQAAVWAVRQHVV